jgi:signal transduction histidine kinase
MWVINVFTIELVLRPMLEGVASRLPASFAPPRNGMSLRTRALLPLPVVTLFAALLVGAYANLSTNGTVRLSIAVGLALVTIAIATVIFVIVNRSVLSPIDDLLAATDRVRGGDLATRVPLVTNDELGTLARSFNDMLADLEHRGQQLELRGDQLRESRERIVATADAERRRMERDLHDGAQQELVLLGLKLGLTQRVIASDPTATDAAFDDLRASLDRALAELRDLAHGIYPAQLESEGLPGALRDASQRAAIPTSFDSDGTGRYPPELEAAVYFCCLEALQNSAKHAGASAQAAVRLAERDQMLRAEIADTGAGFDPATKPASAGLQNMTDRIGAVGGTLTITSAPGAGTTIVATIPLYGA